MRHVRRCVGVGFCNYADWDDGCGLVFGVVNERVRLVVDVLNPNLPRIAFKLAEPERVFSPGDVLACNCRIEAEDAAELLALEASVLWFTEGKGDEDMAVHFFLRRVPSDVEDGDLRSPFELRTKLPNSPLSYDGVIVKVRWCARLRVFLRRGRELCLELPFVMGRVPPAAATETPQSELPPSNPLVTEKSAKSSERGQEGL